jgi:hypothetical protein
MLEQQDMEDQRPVSVGASSFRAGSEHKPAVLEVHDWYTCCGSCGPVSYDNCRQVFFGGDEQVA